ncbi:uncharacterized protein LOC114321147 [Camellia sinensis]|uniref:uncharacterized protein LOC114321147 n=1 Tax=Camellia sinensis TaxID=4442 RepID=UPI001036E284|nr:uncharacterized protein LOC114321147 [Camellia sinensis]
MAESGGYRSIDYSSQVGGRLAYFPDDFKEYVDTQLSCSPVEDYDRDFIGWVFQRRHEPELPPILLHYILDLNYKIKDVLRKYLLDCYVRLHPTLVQFWAPTMTMEGKSYLTTQNQRFALATRVRRIGDVKGLCGYRMISKDYKFYMDRESSDEQLGVPGRVFNHGLPESTPNVEYYSIKEYPLCCFTLPSCTIFGYPGVLSFYPNMCWCT